MRRGLLAATCIVACTADAPNRVGSNEAAVTWTTVTAQGAPRSGHAAVLLPSGRVLVSGGLLDGGGRSTATVFDPTTNAWTPTKDMTARRTLHCLVMIGGVPLAIGGIDTSETSVTATAETWDEKADAWTATGSLATGRRRAACVVLASGKVLVAGGEGAAATPLSSAELYDPATRTFTAVAPLSTERKAPIGVLLADGRALVIGTGGAELFDPATSTWKTLPAAGLPESGGAVRLASDKVLLVGYGATTSMLFDPKTETFAKAGALVAKRAGATLTMLANGSVVAVGGFVPPSTLSNAVEVFDPATSTWTAIDPLRAARFTHSATLLNDGRVLVVGGASTVTLPPPEVLNAPNGAKCTTGDTCMSGICSDGRCCDKACDGACVACDVMGSEGKCTGVSGAPREGHASCRPFLTCSAGACANTCASDSECAPGNLCFPATKTCAPEKGLCDGDHTITDLRAGTKRDCGAYACTPAGECLDKCATSSDCAAGRICGDGNCVAPPTTESDPGGCSQGAAAPSGGAAIALLAALLLLARRRAWPIFLASCAPAPTEHANTQQPLTYSAAGVMKVPTRVYHAAAPLNDGRVLVVGSVGSKFSKTAEVFDPATTTWTPAPNAAVDRALSTATTLADGRVLVVGGNSATNNAELYDPGSNAWTAIPAPSRARSAHIAVRLKDDRVLIAGGNAGGASTVLNSAEIYDPAANAWAATGSMRAGRAFSAAALLGDGRVVIAGGVGSASSTEIYDPATGAFSPGPALPKGRDTFDAASLPDGRVVFGGGQDPSIIAFDGNAFATVGAFAEARLGLRATALLDGRVLFTGGIDESETKPYALVTAFDPKTGKAQPLAPLTSARAYHTATVLTSGRVLLVGGIATYDVDDPVFANPELMNLVTGAKCAANDECASGFCVDGRCCGTSCTEACSACDVAGSEGTCTAIDGRPRDGHATCAPFGKCAKGGCVPVCISDDDCDADHVCEASLCVEPKATCSDSTVTDKASGLTKSCSPYKCRSNGTCLQRCSTSDDCVAASACDQGVCRALASDEDPGCAFGHGGSTRLAVLSLVALVLLGRRKRR